MNKKLLGMALLLSTVATSALAGPKWNQASLSYLSVSTDANDDEITGFGVSGTKLLGSNFFVGGSYASYSEDTGVNSIDADLNFLSLGIGARKAVTAGTDLFGIVSYENVEAALSSGFTTASLDDISGYGLKAGVRSMVTAKFELSAVASYADYGDDITTSGFGVAAAYHFTNQFALGAGYSTAEDEDTLSLTGTISF